MAPIGYSGAWAKTDVLKKPEVKNLESDSLLSGTGIVRKG
jgi:hypothetical protein